MKRRLHFRRRKEGFTLLELLLGLLLTTIILAGIYNMFGSQEKAQLVVDQVAEMNQNIRAAMLWVTRDLRQAGLFLETNLGGINSVLVYDGGDPADGYDTDSVDVLYADANIRTALTQPMPAESSELNVVNTDGFSIGDLICITDGNNTSMVQVTQIQDAALKIQHNPASSYNWPGGSGVFPGYGTGSRVCKILFRSYCIDHTDPNHPMFMRKDHPVADPSDLTCTGTPVADYIEEFQITPIADNNQSYTVQMRARTRKRMAIAGGMRRKSIAQLINVRNL